MEHLNIKDFRSPQRYISKYNNIAQASFRTPQAARELKAKLLKDIDTFMDKNNQYITPQISELKHKQTNNIDSFSIPGLRDPNFTCSRRFVNWVNTPQPTRNFQ